jgi:hypothetical protein
MSPLPPGRVVVPSEVVRRAFGSETVLLNLTTGQYHGLNATGARMLDLLEETGDAAATAKRVADEAGVDEAMVSADLADLCEQLEGRGLIVVEGT